MHTYITKLTSKYQTSVPKAVREILHLQAADQIAYDILEDNTIVIRKATPFDVEYLNALIYTMNEWKSDEDEKAFGNL